jgi:sulfur carrier protein
MTVIVNGEPAQATAGETVAGLLAALGHPPGGPGIAVALNGEVVPRAAWATTGLHEHDRIEVLGATQGG